MTRRNQSATGRSLHILLLFDSFHIEPFLVPPQIPVAIFVGNISTRKKIHNSVFFFFFQIIISSCWKSVVNLAGGMLSHNVIVLAVLNLFSRLVFIVLNQPIHGFPPFS